MDSLFSSLSPSDSVVLLLVLSIPPAFAGLFVLLSLFFKTKQVYVEICGCVSDYTGISSSSVRVSFYEEYLALKSSFGEIEIEYNNISDFEFPTLKGLQVNHLFLMPTPLKQL